MFGLSPAHFLIFGIVAILLFGNRLPSVARSLGRSLVEFKKGMTELENEFKASVYSEPTTTTTTPRVTYNEHSSEPAAPRFEPPKAQDVASTEPKKAVVVD
ncbi:MAG TPA: twin-arginine translocase TatA/TatE family subunit [Lacipirellulaceae bacterium]|nr:twin-arginine translocase TatA/TatE family subunit [Lacipirellulaceae bacterium]